MNPSDMPKRKPSAPPSVEMEPVTQPATNKKSGVIYGPYPLGRSMWIPGNGSQNATLELLHSDTGKRTRRTFLLRVGDQRVCFPASTGFTIGKTTLSC